ncbi:MAG: DUF481 domain-containing protein [Flavobacteriales bacterium]|nr:DUF481 domain-containing protein [Flavobacteriales bacterium]
MRLVTLIFLLGFTIQAQAQDLNPNRDSVSNNDLAIFIDCNFCDISFMKQNLQHVNFVRDRKVAEVHLLFTRQRNGAGGWAERIQFIGMGNLAHLTDTLEYTIDVNMTQDEKRKTQLRYMQFGLLRFWLEKGMDELITIDVKEADTSMELTPEDDPWNNWVFGLNAGGWFNGQETSNSLNFYGNISAKRITEKNKLSIRAGGDQNLNYFNYDGVETKARQQSSWLRAQEIISISDHWSYGFFGEAGNSVFSNYKFYGDLGAGIEYDVFEYEDSYEKQLIVAYHAGGRYNDYYDTTVFNKDEELVGWHKLILGASTNKEWGKLSSTITYRNYLHDFSLNSISFWMNFNVRLFKGFSWRVNGSFSVNHNQINISKQGATPEEVLLQQQQLGSGYNYWMNTGLNYSFGSIYNTVVNPRFDF